MGVISGYRNSRNIQNAENPLSALFLSNVGEMK